MLKAIRRQIRLIVAALNSSRGHNAMVFVGFLILSAVLWWVMALSDEEQSDVRLPLRITNVPDSVTIISPAPSVVAVSLRTRGSQLLRLNFGRIPDLEVDFRAFRTGSSLKLTDADIKALARSALGGASITVVTPDTLNLRFTTEPGQLVPVRPDVLVTPGPQATLAGEPVLAPDSVLVYSTAPISVSSVVTEPIRLNGINRTTTRRARIIPPKGARVIPDSVDVTSRVEPMILKTRRINIDPVNVPLGRKLITFPAQINVSYMVPMSIYKKSEPRIRAVADYRTIDTDRPSRMMRIRLADVSPDLRNVQLETDSVEYIIEKL